jgi:hypothetical protein
MSHLRYFFMFAYSGVQHILCCVFCFLCLRLVYRMLPVSLYCPFLIAPSVFSNVYLGSRPIHTPNVKIQVSRHTEG